MTEPLELHFEVGSDGWTTVKGATEIPLKVKARVYGGVVRVVGLTLDGDGAHRLTKRQLRGVPLDQISIQLQRFLDGKAREALQLRADEAEARAAFGPTFQDLNTLPPNPLEPRPLFASASQADQDRLEEWLGLLSKVHERQSLEGWLKASTTAPSPRPPARGRGAKPPTDDDYRRFANIYLRELERGEHGAKTRTAREFGVNRGTVYRWIDECVRKKILAAEHLPVGTRRSASEGEL